MACIPCIIVDDEQEAIDRMKHLLKHFDEIQVLDTATRSEEAISGIIAQKPAMVFLDVEMPRISGFEIVRSVREKNLFPCFVFVTAYNQYAIKAIKKQAFDYLLKPVDIDELKDAIERYKLSAPTFIHEQQFMHLLTCREREIMQLVAAGNTSREIAGKLHISKHTVDTHRRNIHSKMQSENSPKS